MEKLAGRQILRIDDQFSEESKRALAGFFLNQSLSNELCDGHRQKALNFLFEHICADVINSSAYL